MTDYERSLQGLVQDVSRAFRERFPCPACPSSTAAEANACESERCCGEAVEGECRRDRSVVGPDGVVYWADPSGFKNTVFCDLIGSEDAATEDGVGFDRVGSADRYGLVAKPNNQCDWECRAGDVRDALRAPGS